VASHGADEVCETCLRDWYDTLAVLDAVRAGDLAGARLVLREADAAEVGMRLATIVRMSLDSDEWTGEPLGHLIAGHWKRFMRLEAEMAG
jgi:hypothetical protein